MFAKFKDIFAKRNKDLRKRILFTLVALAVFIVGTNVRVPGTSKVTSDLGFLELLNVRRTAIASIENNNITSIIISPKSIYFP